MTTFSHKHERYPDLSFATTLFIQESAPPALYVKLKVWGEVKDRERWRGQFKRWCAENGLAPDTMYGNARTPTTSEFVLNVTGWSLIAEFMIRWVGLPWMIKSALGAEGIARRIGLEVDGLRKALDKQTSMIDEVRTRTMVTDYRLWAAGRAMVGQELAGIPGLPQEFNWSEDEVDSG